MLAHHLRSLTRTHWVIFFAGLALCWAMLFAMAAPADLRAMEATYGPAFIELICGGALGASGFGPAFGMWALMSAAMMTPTAIPALAVYDDLSHATETKFAHLLGGYITVWFGFSVLAGGAQVSLYEVGLLGSFGQSVSLPLTVSLLVGAGLYQFSPLKEACLSRCRAPLTFFMQNWDIGPFRMGVRMGADCLGCCWALMLLGFVGGTMNLAFMGLALALMTLEKLPDLGRFVTRPLGVALITAGLALPLFGI